MAGPLVRALWYLCNHAYYCPHRSANCSESAEAIASWLPRLHALVIGPGLGRDPSILATVKAVIAVARRLQKDIVIDAVSPPRYLYCMQHSHTDVRSLKLVTPR